MVSATHPNKLVLRAAHHSHVCVCPTQHTQGFTQRTNKKTPCGMLPAVHQNKRCVDVHTHTPRTVFPMQCAVHQRFV